MYAIIIHGGAGALREDLHSIYLQGVQTAAQIGLEILQADGSAIDAVVAAVVELEDNPAFNAGTGSVLNAAGEVEMDAGLMAGDELRSGNVACVRHIKNPIVLARCVMEHTDHVLLAGSGAERFGQAMGFADFNPITEQRRMEWQTKRASLLAGERTPHDRHQALLQQHPELSKGTVGAVALNTKGRLAAATSTGGVALKLPGRIGDTPVPGAGNYATRLAAVSATGQGELMLRCLTAKTVCDAIAQGLTPQQAIDKVLHYMVAEIGTDVGIIALDRQGNVGAGHATPAMAHAYASQRETQVLAHMTAKS